MIDLKDCTKIRFTQHVDESGNITSMDYEWQGDLRITGATFAFIEEADPEWITFPALADIAIGDEAIIGPYRLKVIEVDRAREIVFFERID
jgi:hypothetical protein